MRQRTASDEVVDQRILAPKEEFIQQSPPVVALLDKLVLEEVNPGTLVSE